MTVIRLSTKQRLGNFVEDNKCLPLRSYAYRPRRSTNFCFNEFVLHILVEKTNKWHAVATTLDIQSAYDKVVLGLVKDILEHNIPANIARQIFRFLSERSLAINQPAPFQFWHSPPAISQYALRDFMIISGGKTREEAISRLIIATKCSTEKCNYARLPISFEKFNRTPDNVERKI